MGAQVLEKGVVLKAQDGRLVVGVRRMVRGSFGRLTVRTTKLYVDDSRRMATTGDTVVVQFTRPVSSSKRWRLVEVTRKAESTAGEDRDA